MSEAEPVRLALIGLPVGARVTSPLDQARQDSPYCDREAMAEEGIPISYVPTQEMRCILHWFAQWTEAQRSHFLQDLLGKALPAQLCLLLDGLGSLNLSAPPPSLFQCQMRLWDQWFQSWDEDERNEFLRRLGQQDPDFVAFFHKQVNGTASKD